MKLRNTAAVAFYGEALGIVSGVLQINVQIPTTVPAGNLAVQISVGRANSQSGVNGVGAVARSPCILICIRNLKMETACHSNQSHAGKLRGLPLPSGLNAA